MNKIELAIKVQNEDGLHARPAGILAKAISKFTSKVELAVSEKKINAKSIMSIMSLGLKGGDEILFSAEGDDASAVIEKIKKLFENNFQE
jgi:phosphocarrier protein